MTSASTPPTSPSSESQDDLGLNKHQHGILLLSILIVALCGITYELIISTVSSYLLGNSVYQFSLTIGFFMFAMGAGSYLSKLLDNQLVRNFIVIEIAIALVGGACSILLFMTFPLARELYELVMYSLILIIGILVGMEIPILTTILSKRATVRDSIANVMSIDYLGALIGSVAFPLFLLPHVGLVQSSFVIGLINILTALVNVYFFRHHIKHSKLLTFLCLFITATLITLLIAGSKVTSFAEKHLYFDQVIYEKQTPYQHITVTRSKTTREHRLYIDGHIQFASRDEYRYHEALVHPLMSVPGKKENVLILGGGDGLAVRELLKYDEIKRIDLVDIDPEMTKVATDLFLLVQLNQESLKNEKVTVYNQDAFTFINQAGIKYDRVIIDMPDPHNEAINKLYSREFYKMVNRRMAEGSVLISQSSSPFFTKQTYWSIGATLDHVFDELKSFHVTIPSFGVWGFHMVTKNSEFPQHFQLDKKVKEDIRSLDDQSLAAAMVFPKDIAYMESPVNSIMEPVLYQLYLDDLKI